MVFSSVPFLYYFLPCALLLYFAVPGGFKNTALLLASIVFYAWGEPGFVLVMLLSILQGYLFGLWIETGIKRGSRRLAQVCLLACAVISLGLLGYCKYADFFITNFNRAAGLSLPLLRVALPVGISFYTFQILSYVADVYRGSVPAQRNLIRLAAYIAMFPQLIAGPIVRYADIEKDLNGRTCTVAGCALGIRRFILGLGKKVLIANTLGELCTAFQKSEDKSVLFFWLYALACALQLYFDFSGYSDMAIGLGRILGFDFPENFNYPYVAKSVTEFWRRWHISLGSWFRDYVYIPLGGNRVGRRRMACNLMIVWFLTGFWHGAEWNFIAWGLLFGILIIAEKLAAGRMSVKRGHVGACPAVSGQSRAHLVTDERVGVSVGGAGQSRADLAADGQAGVLSRLCGHVYVVLVVLVSFVLFDAPGIPEAFQRIGAMFGMGGFPAVSGESLYYLKSYAPLLAAAGIGATPLLSAAVRRLREREAVERALNLAEPAALVALLLAATGYIVDGSFNPFLYFRF